jgi:ATP-dependent RNA helicase RhlE
VETFLQEHFNHPVKVEAAPAGTPVENVTQTAFSAPNFYSKVNLLKSMLNDNALQKVLVFTGSRALADMLMQEMENVLPERIGVIHSNKSQNYRFNAVNSFQDGKYRVLIATDLVARGIDITEVSHVINFDVPESPENYVHRIGRTGRADKKGEALTFVTPSDEESFAAILRFTGSPVELAAFPEGVEISDELTEMERPVQHLPNVFIKLPKPSEAGAAFHEKKAKNQKVNVRYNHKKAMQEKYGKPKKRRSKK